MKRLSTLVAAICTFFAAMAQHPMVTLSHDGQLSFFSDIYAFTSAVDSAKNGDTIYLPEGELMMKNNKITIKKRLSVVGSGYKSHLLGSITYDYGAQPKITTDAPLFDGVKLDALDFSTTYIGSEGQNSWNRLGTTAIVRTWIGQLRNGGYAGTDVTYDKCYIETGYFNIPNNTNVLLKNSKIGQMYNVDDVTVMNCNVDKCSYVPKHMISTIYNAPTVAPNLSSVTYSIINSLLRVQPTSSNINCYNCYVQDDDLLDDNLEAIPQLEGSGYLGQDGTVVGVYGGEEPFSVNPSVPTVNTDASSVVYDAENNKLKVKIAVKAD